MKYTDILCEPSPIMHDAQGEKGPCGWPHLFSPAPAQYPSGPAVSPERTSRSRSTPVHTNLEEECLRTNRQRSPSAAPRNQAQAQRVQANAQDGHERMPRRPRRTIRSQPLSYLIYNGGEANEAASLHTGAGVGARNGFTRVSAYYSVRPPAIPMQLVPVSPPAPPALPALPPHSATSSPPLRTSAYIEQLDEELCKNAVRSVLCELMAALPLSSSSSPTRPPHMSRARRVHQADDPRSPLPASPSRPRASVLISPSVRSASPRHYNADERNRCSEAHAWSAGSTGSPGSAVSAGCTGISRHVATQAHTSLPSDSCNPDPTENADEWLGGVRALRDSHVRLVLRQLRHIERLNRALDRASRVSPARSSPRSHAASATHGTVPSANGCARPSSVLR